MTGLGLSVLTDCKEVLIADLPGLLGLLFYFSVLLVSALKFRVFFPYTSVKEEHPTLLFVCLFFSLCFSKAKGSFLTHTAQKSLQGLELTDAKPYGYAFWKHAKLPQCSKPYKALYRSRDACVLSIRNLGLCIQCLSEATLTPHCGASGETYAPSHRGLFFTIGTKANSRRGKRCPSNILSITLTMQALQRMSGTLRSSQIMP